MRALVHDPEAPAGLRPTDVEDVAPAAPDELLIDVRAVSINYLDIAYRDVNMAAGGVPGVDAAGVVVTAAEDGSGPPVGARVAGFGFGGAWAQRRVMQTADVAVVPDEVELTVAAALPAAGVTALQVVRRLGSLIGRRVLITGASGGVGRYAVQLAAASGAHVIAAVGSTARGEGLRELGAAEVVTDLGQLDGSVHGVLDNVGGPLLAEAFARLVDGGLALSVGKASQQDTTFDFEAMRQLGGFRSVASFVVTGPFGPDLSALLELVARGALDPQIGRMASWDDAPAVAQALLDRRIAGKAVLTIG